MENRTQLSLFIVIPALLAALFAGYKPAQPNSCSWNGTKDTDWANADNWGCGHKPGAGDDVVIPWGTPYSPSLSGSDQIGHLSVSGHLSFNAQLSTTGWVAAGSGEISGNYNSGGALVGDGDVSGSNVVLYGQFDGILTIESGATAKLHNITLTKDLNLAGTLDGYDPAGTLHMHGDNFNNNGQVKVATIYFDSQGVQHIHGNGSWEESISLLSIEDGTTLLLDNDMTFHTRLFNTGVNKVNDLNIGNHAIAFAGTVAPDPNPNTLMIGSHLIGTGSIHTQGYMQIDVSGHFAPDLFVDTGVTLANTSIGFDGQITVAGGAELRPNTVIANNRSTTTARSAGAGSSACTVSR